jgi:hypothetical protein
VKGEELERKIGLVNQGTGAREGNEAHKWVKFQVLEGDDQLSLIR